MKEKFTQTKKLIGILAILLFAKLGSAQVTASFTYTMGAAGTVTFTNLSSSTATNMCCDLWSIFDSPTPSQPSGTSIVHTFTANGNYLVRLVAIDQLNNADSTQSVITITNTACVAAANLSFWSPSPTNWIAGIWGMGNIVAADWNWGDASPNSSGLTPSHTYSVSGNYNVCVSFTNACGASTTICKSQFFSRTEAAAMQYVSVVSTNPAQTNFTTDMKSLEKSEMNLEIYPNPSSGIFEITNVNEGKFEIMNSIGQTVYNFTLSGGSENTINLSNLPAGIYYLKSNLSSKSKKIIINN